MKCYKRVASAVMGMAMAASCMAPITAYAMEDTKQPTDNTAILLETSLAYAQNITTLYIRIPHGKRNSPKRKQGSIKDTVR